MDILLGTTNPSKVLRFEGFLAGYPVRFYTLKDLGITGEPEETGRDPLENAILKADFYSRFFPTVICNDSGLYLDPLPLDDPRQPGLHIRTPGGDRRLDDEETLRHYTALVHSLGGRVLAYYLDGLVVRHNGQLLSFLTTPQEARANSFYLVDTPSPIRRPGWPLDSISVNRDSGTDVAAAGSDPLDQDRAGYRRRVVRFLVEALGLEGLSDHI